MTQGQIDRLHDVTEAWTAEEVVRWAFDNFGQDLGIASGFGAEGVVMIDIAARISPSLQVFTLDTEYLFPETYKLMERIEEHYHIKVERLYSEVTPQEQATSYGPALWTRNPDQCCNLRKVEPLKRKLSGLRAWMTAIRRDQTTARATAGKVEWDTTFRLVKINPLADWTSEVVWGYIRANNLSYNPLHDHDYPSVGCVHCTRAVVSDEHPRAGRWPGSEKTECGLHTREKL